MAGLVGSVVLGVAVEKTRKFKLIFALTALASILTIAGFLGLLFTGSMVAISIIIGLQGFFLTAFIPLGFEFSAELTFPVGEATSGGLLMGVAQLFGAIEVILSLPYTLANTSTILDIYY